MAPVSDLGRCGADFSLGRQLGPAVDSSLPKSVKPALPGSRRHPGEKGAGGSHRLVPWASEKLTEEQEEKPSIIQTIGEMQNALGIGSVDTDLGAGVRNTRHRQAALLVGHWGGQDW